MPVLLFQLALIVIFLHAVYQIVVDTKENGLTNAASIVSFLYQVAIAVASVWFYLTTL
jgi:heme/copper-type cytochrome/quinol oxidase subunit 4